jgi:hypothetical protein
LILVRITGSRRKLALFGVEKRKSWAIRFTQSGGWVKPYIFGPALWIRRSGKHPRLPESPTSCCSCLVAITNNNTKTTRWPRTGIWLKAVSPDWTTTSSSTWKSGVEIGPKLTVSGMIFCFCGQKVVAGMVYRFFTDFSFREVKTSPKVYEIGMFY